ncbi:MAG: hypothetical protein WDZ41_00420 [Candidatus Babeliales bacterium]
MPLISSLFSIGIGCLLGIIYGFSLIQMKTHFFFKAASPSQISLTIIGMARIIFLACIFGYILRLSSIHSILVIVPFLISYWCTILTRKNYYDRT